MRNLGVFFVHRVRCRVRSNEDPITTKTIYSIDGVNDSKYYESYTDALVALDDYEHDGGQDFTNGDPTSSARFVKPADGFFGEQAAFIRRHTLVLA